MSKKRSASWKDYPKKKVNGKWICRWCGKECVGRRTSFCSNDCRHELLVRTTPSYARKVVYRRDKGICQLCGLDTKAKVKELRILKKTQGFAAWKKRLEELEIPEHRKTLYDIDHIVPVIDGGGECSTDMLRLLCIWCHKKVTANLKKRLAMERKVRNYKRKLGEGK